MKGFHTKVVDLRDEWQKWLNTGVKHRPQIKRVRDRRAGLVVKFPDGKVIKESTATETFARASKEFSIDKVERLGKMANNWPLVSSKKSPDPI
jgi:hypothetical protein